MRRVATMMALLLCACDPIVPVALELPSSTKAVLFAVVTRDGDLHLQASARGAEPLAMPIVARDGTMMWVVAYPYALAELQIAPGPVAVLENEGSGRALPERFDRLYEAVLDGDETRGFQTIDVLPAPLRDVRLPQLDVIACDRDGGCLVHESTPEQTMELCTIPCPAPSMITPPDPPQLSPCPAGWRARSQDLPARPEWCEPPPLPLRIACTDGQVQYYGEVTCSRVGSACPAPPNIWPANLPTDRELLYVRAGAGPGGDGSRTSPFDSLAHAVRTSTAGNAIALSIGELRESVVIDRPLLLIGACAGATKISAPADAPAIEVTASAELVDLHAQSSSIAILLPIGAEHLGLRDAIVDGDTAIRGGAFTATSAHFNGRVELSAARPSSFHHVVVDAPGKNAGIFVRFGSEVTIDDIVITASAHAVFANRGARVRVEGAAFYAPIAGRANGVSTALSLFDVRAESPIADVGAAMWTTNRAGATAQRCSFRGYFDGIVSDTVGSTTITDSLIEGSVRGLRTGVGGRLLVERTAVFRTRGAGLVTDRGKTVLRDVLIQDAVYGVSADRDVSLERVWLAGNFDGLIVDDAAARETPVGAIRASSLVIEGTRSRALAVFDSISVALDRVHLFDNVGGVELGEYAELEASDLLIERTGDKEDSAVIAVREGSKLVVEKFRFSGPASSGVELDQGLWIPRSGVPARGEMFLGDGVIEAMMYGATINLADEVDAVLRRSFDRVTFRNNVQSFRSSPR